MKLFSIFSCFSAPSEPTEDISFRRHSTTTQVGSVAREIFIAAPPSTPKHKNSITPGSQKILSLEKIDPIGIVDRFLLREDILENRDVNFEEKYVKRNFTEGQIGLQTETKTQKKGEIFCKT